MPRTNAATDTTQALQAALKTARREREELAQRLATVDQLIADLSQAAEGGDGRRRARAAGKRTGRKAAAKRPGRKTAAKRRGGKRTAKKASSTSTGRGARKAAKRQAPGRTSRVVSIVRESPEPLTTGEVRSRLSQDEPDVSSKLVSAALTYAQRKGEIARTENRRWAGA